MATIEFHNASTNEWVDQFSRTPEDEDGIRIVGLGRGHGVPVLMFHDSPGNDWNTQKLAHFNERVRRACEFRKPRASLSDDDPDKHVDPGRKNFYWEGNDLVNKPVEITFFYAEDSAIGPYLCFTYKNVGR